MVISVNLAGARERLVAGRERRWGRTIQRPGDFARAVAARRLALGLGKPLPAPRKIDPFLSRRPFFASPAPPRGFRLLRPLSNGVFSQSSA